MADAPFPVPAAPPAALDDLLGGAGLKAVTAGIQMPRMNFIMERWYKPADARSWTAG
ncbi:hypothetical protein [Streptomyces sp. 8N616]|uniref:hypothetical protein n=1 Tax=Streptomyces sp. 8N616 TaxID=3457414 RepID=UPI003FCF3AA8